MHPSPTITRQVWKEVTQTPNVSTHEIARRLGCGPANVHYALHNLRDLGYVSFDDRTRGNRRVLVPFCEVR